jgi:hypothetical protein
MVFTAEPYERKCCTHFSFPKCSLCAASIILFFICLSYCFQEITIYGTPLYPFLHLLVSSTLLVENKAFPLHVIVELGRRVVWLLFGSEWSASRPGRNLPPGK